MRPLSLSSIGINSVRCNKCLKTNKNNKLINQVIKDLLYIYWVIQQAFFSIKPKWLNSLQAIGLILTYYISNFKGGLTLFFLFEIVREKFVRLGSI
jgi:hypothetical protein